MVANVETMMYAGEVPWHGIGTRVADNVNSEQAMQLAGLDWTVSTAPIVTNDDKRTGVDAYRVTRRDTDNVILGVVKRSFKPIQNVEAFRMFDNIIDNRPLYHTAGSLQGGSKVFITAKIKEPLIVGKDQGADDQVDRYLLLSNAHDGTRPLKMLFTPVRVVCSNTLSIALDVKNSSDKVTRLSPSVSIRHTNVTKHQIKEAERVMKRALKWYEKFGEFSNYLASKQLRSTDVNNVIGAVFPPNAKFEVTPTVSKHRTEVSRLFTDGIGHEKIAGSAWALFNAFTQYADHTLALKGATEPGDRSYSILIGGAKGLKSRATKVINDFVTV